ncbi:hypothetical protein ACOSQ3_016942 [Xanthoceras sorbifolium]
MNLFNQQSMAKVLQLRHELQSVRKCSLGISDYILKIKEIGDDLLAAGQVITDYDLLASMLGGLGHEFDPVVVFISSERNTVTMQEAQYLLMLHKQRIEQLNISKQLDVSSSISTNFAASNNGDKKIYKNCRRKLQQ